MKLQLPSVCVAAVMVVLLSPAAPAVSKPLLQWLYHLEEKHLE